MNNLLRPGANTWTVNALARAVNNGTERATRGWRSRRRLCWRFGLGQTWEDHAQWIAAAWILTTTNGQCRDAPAHDVHGLEDVQLENHNSKFTDPGLNAVTKGQGIEKGHRFQE